MKSVYLFFVSILLFVLCGFQHSQNGFNPNQAYLAKKINEIIHDQTEVVIYHNVNATVTFTINGANEIVVLKVEADHHQEQMDYLIKDLLNYEKMDQIIPHEIYRMPLKFIKHS